MTWTSSAAGIFTHTTTIRDFYQCDRTENVLGSLYEIRAQCTDSAGNVKILVRASGDGGTGIECGVEGANLIIRPVEFRAVGAALATIAHGIPASTEYTLRVRQTNEGLACAVILSTGAIVEVTSTTNLYRSYRRWGLISNVDNAIVPWIWNATLEPIFSDATDILAIVASGDLWASFDHQTLTLVQASIMPLVGKVSMGVQDGDIYIVGGGKAKIFDPVAETVSDWQASDHPTHKLPGATDPGTTTATIVMGYRGGICLAVENLVYRSAIGDPLMWDTAELAQGRAWVIGGNINRSGLSIGDRILALSVLSENALFIGGINSSMVLLGDPVDGAAELRPLMDMKGISGPNAIALVEEGRTVFHCPEGLYSLMTGGSPVCFSKNLSESIVFNRADRESHTVTLIRDPARDGLHIFISGGTGLENTHFWYDEEDDYARGSAGFFPEKYPWTPTCACIWRGRVIIGTAEGRIVHFEDSVRTDLGTDIDSFIPFTVLQDQPNDFEVLVDNVYPLVSSECEPFDVTLYGARTVEEVFDETARTELAHRNANDTVPDVIEFKQRSPVCLVQLRGRYLVVEALAADIRGARNISRAKVLAAATLPEPCTSPLSSETSSGPVAPAFGPGSGAIEAPPPGSGDDGLVIG